MSLSLCDEPIEGKKGNKNNLKRVAVFSSLSGLTAWNQVDHGMKAAPPGGTKSVPLSLVCDALTCDAVKTSLVGFQANIPLESLR